MNNSVVVIFHQSRRVRRMVHAAQRGEMRNACKRLVGKAEGKRALGRSGHRWDDKIIADPKGTGF